MAAQTNWSVALFDDSVRKTKEKRNEISKADQFQRSATPECEASKLFYVLVI